MLEKSESNLISPKLFKSENYDMVEDASRDHEQLDSGEKMKKIVVMSSHTPSLFWFRMDMMKHFQTLGYEVVAIGNEDEATWIEHFQKHNVRYLSVDISRTGTDPRKDVAAFQGLHRVLRKEMPDKIFTYQAKTIIFGTLAARSLGIRDIYPLIAGMGSVFLHNDLKSAAIRKILFAEYKVALHKCPVVFFQNQDDAQIFLDRKLVKTSQVCLIHGSGVNLDRFSMLPMPSTTAFLCISRLIRDKGVYEYLEACRAIRKEFPQVRCLLVGPFDSNPSALKAEELQPFIDDGSVEYYGEQEDVRPFLEQCSVFVLPSYREGTPKTVLEAMACGRAVITTDTPGCRETIIDGESGYFVPPRNIEKLSEKMQDFIAEPWKAANMGVKGRLRAEELFDVNKVNLEIAKVMDL